MEAPPPPYEEVAGSSSSANQPRPTQPESQSHLKVRNGIPPSMRRSMEDEGRPLPEGWVRSYDADEHHHFYVDTTQEPHRSIWHHPYDDDTYMESLPEKERARIRATHPVPSKADIAAMSSDDDDDHHHDSQQKQKQKQPASKSDAASGAAAGPSNSSNPQSGASRFGRRLKDKLTNSTHEEREVQRQQRAREEAEYYESHRQIRQAMVEAERTGQPQFIGKDPRTGQDTYLEPPNGPRSPPGARGINPYNQGPYTNPNAKFVRPRDPYSRPYGGGYGGGYGLPLAAGLGGGLLGGLLIGDALGGFGGGL